MPIMTLPVAPPAAPQALRVASADRQSTGSFTVEHYSPRQALQLGLRMGLKTLLWAVLSIVVPVVHFVSVPLGILAAPIVGLYYFRTRRGAPMSMSAQFDCPECHAANQVSAPKLADRYESTCRHCQQKLELIPLPQSST